jgi:hypothetical protein
LAKNGRETQLCGLWFEELELVNANKGCAKDQVVRCWPLIVEAQVVPRSVDVEFVVHKAVLGWFFSEFFVFPPTISFH